MMRVMLLLLSVLSISAFGQSDSSRYQKFSGYGFRADRLWGYSVLLAPSDTTNNKLGLARIGTNLYVGNGTRWTAAGGSVDTTVISTRAWRQKGLDSLATAITLQKVINNSATLTQNNTINSNGNNLTIQDASQFIITGSDSVRIASPTISLPSLTAGAITDSLLTWRNGSLKYINPSRVTALNTLQTVTGNGNSTTLDSILINGMKVGYNSILFNTYFGATSLDGNSGENITAIGQNSVSNNSGSNITGLGRDASSNNTGSNVTAIGESASSNNTGSNVTAIGQSASSNNTGSNVTAIGQSAATNNILDSTIHIGTTQTTATAKNQVIYNTGKGNYRLNLSNLTADRDRTIANASGTEVLSVNSQTANSSGAITLTAANVGALGTGDSLTAIRSNFTSIGRAYKIADSLAAAFGTTYLRLTDSTLYSTKAYVTKQRDSMVAVNNGRYLAFGGNSTTAGFGSRIGTTGSTALRFVTGGTERMFLDSVNTRLGIGTSSPTQTLQIGAGNIFIQAGSLITGTTAGIQWSSDANKRMRVNSSGDWYFDNSAVIVGGITAAATAQLDIQSTTKGLLIPRMTTAQWDAISSKAQGLEAFDVTQQKPMFVGTSSGITQWVNGTVFTQTNTVTVSNTTTESTVLGTGIGTKTIPANFLTAGKTIRLIVRGYMNETSTPTIRIRLKVGSVTVFDSNPVTINALGGTDKYFDAIFDITCRTTGTTGTVMPQGRWLYTANSGQTSVINGAVTATSTINTTISNALDLTVEWGTASTSNNVNATNCSIEIIN